MPMFLIDLDGADARTLGVLSRRLLEIRANTFVGSLPARGIEQTWGLVCESSPRAALLIVAQKNELGLRLEAIGQHRYKPADFDGISLVTFTKERKSF